MVDRDAHIFEHYNQPNSLFQDLLNEKALTSSVYLCLKYIRSHSYESNTFSLKQWVEFAELQEVSLTVTGVNVDNADVW